MEMELQVGRPENIEGRLEKEICFYVIHRRRSFIF